VQPSVFSGPEIRPSPHVDAPSVIVGTACTAPALRSLQLPEPTADLYLTAGATAAGLCPGRARIILARAILQAALTDTGDDSLEEPNHGVY